MRSSSRGRSADWLCLGAVLVFAFFAVHWTLYTSWTATDEGVLGQGAIRVSLGELPHRDFVDLWSGGLNYLNAWAFRWLGVSLATLRTVVMGAWLLGVAFLFAGLRTIVGRTVATAATLCAVCWTLPLSPEPLPSWYNLTLALGGSAAVLQYLRSRARGWLVLAGAAAGASIAVKIVGLYFVAAVLLLLVWLVQEWVPGEGRPEQPPSAKRPYAWLITAGLLLFLALVFALVAGVGNVRAVVHFALPASTLVGMLLWREWRLGAGADRARLRELVRLTVPFAGGMLAALLVWMTPYIRAHALGDLARGLFVTPRVRFSVAQYPLPGLRVSLLSTLPFVLLLVLGPKVRTPLRRSELALLAVLVLALGALSYGGSPIVLVVWNGLRLLTPMCVLLAAWWLMRPPAGMAIAHERRAPVFFLVAAACTCSLVQIPFGLYTYFLYFFPMLLLALTALTVAQPAMPRAIPAALLAFVLLFGLRGPGSMPNTDAPRSADALALLALPRGGLNVRREDSTTYASLIRVVRAHAHGDWMYVWHDAPQIYFLAALRNPTKTTFEVFDDSAAAAPATLKRALQTHDVRVVVLTDSRNAPRPMDEDFRRWLLAEYPMSQAVETYEVRWR